VPSTSELTLPGNLRLDLQSSVRLGRPSVVLSSGYGIFGFGEPLQVALTARLDELDIGWVQYTYPERNAKNRITDLLISSGAGALLGVYDWLRSRGPSEIGMFGISFGANVTLEVALQRDPKLIMLVNPVFDYVDYRTKQLGEDAMARWGRDGRITIDYESAEVVSYYRFIEEARDQDLLRRCASINADVIACQGDADPILTAANVRTLANCSPRFSSVIAPGADHVFTSEAAVSCFLDAVDVRLRRWGHDGGQ
jgi:pimeloyl-ACP methyl ester carboxylesterase